MVRTLDSKSLKISIKINKLIKEILKSNRYELTDKQIPTELTLPTDVVV